MNAPLDLSGLKMPPHHAESEQAVLGGLLQDNAAMDRIADLLGETDFYTQQHRQIYRALMALIDSGKQADVITVAEFMQAAGILEQVGGLPYLVSLTNNTPGSGNIRRYAEIVRERSVLRKLAEAGMRITDMAFAPGQFDSRALLDDAQKALSEIDTATATTDAIPVRDAMRQMVENVDAAFHGTDKKLKTGFKDLDRQIVGMAPGDMVVVAGRPSMGKTAFALQIAGHVSETDTVLVFSLEMPSDQLAMRMAASIGKLDITALRSGQLEDDGWQRLTYATGKLVNRPLHIDDRSGLSMHQIRARARQVKRKHGLGLVIIDYIGLIYGEGENRVQVVSEISRQIKSMARELAVPVIALSQLNRGLATRNDKRPMMSDLRDSGGIEQDADVIILLHREEYYNPDTDWKGAAECIVAKQRNGATGMIPLAFLAEYAQFGDFAGRYEPDRQQRKKRGFE